MLFTSGGVELLEGPSCANTGSLFDGFRCYGDEPQIVLCELHNFGTLVRRLMGLWQGKATESTGM